MKSYIKDVCVLVDMKADAEDLKRSIDEIHKVLKYQAKTPSLE